MQQDHIKLLGGLGENGKVWEESYTDELGELHGPSHTKI